MMLIPPSHFDRCLLSTALLQIVLEVHDVDGRLAATVELLQTGPAAFDEVCWEPQVTSEVSGYVMVVPEALKMFLVFAKRRQRRSTKPSVIDEDSVVKGNSDDGRGRGSRTGVVLDGDQNKDAAHSSGISGGESKKGSAKGTTTSGAIPPRFCSCPSAVGGVSVSQPH